MHKWVLMISQIWNLVSQIHKHLREIMTTSSKADLFGGVLQLAKIHIHNELQSLSG